jgi:hypothetical protein
MSALEPLAKFIPAGTLPLIQQMLADEAFHLVITRPRTTKLGDFRPPRHHETPKLTVNGNLNPYNFLITLVHEIAHLKVWRQYKNRVAPHGPEWKQCYSTLLSEFMGKGFFPEDIEKAMRIHIATPKYSSSVDQQLVAVLHTHDGDSDLIYVSELASGTLFNLQNKLFKRGEKLRKYYLCEEVSSGKKYRVNGMARVVPHQNKPSH